MKQQPSDSVGALLVADFSTVLTSIALSEFAADEAKRSEDQLLDQLASLGNSGYLSPGTIDGRYQDSITKNSLDVHVKKVQAQQLAQLSTQQLQELVSQARPKYTGRRILVIPLNPKDPPVDTVWFNQQIGYHTTQFKGKQIIGTIEDVRLEENMLILRPSLPRRLITPGLHNYLVYVIDPNTLIPMVTIRML